MSNVRVSLSYRHSTVAEFPEIAGVVRDGVYGNPGTFATPPLTQLDYQAQLDDYNNKRYLYVNGGKAQKGPYQEAKDKLMGTLNSFADYVNGIAMGDENIILLSGYTPTKGTRSDYPTPAQPVNVVITRGASGVLYAECEKIDFAINYGCILSAGAPLPANMVMNGKGQLSYVDGATPAPDNAVTGFIDFNLSRRKEFKNLDPGTVYHFVFFAANATGVSALSTSKSLMCG